MGYSRRNFIENSVTATTALFLTSLDVFASPLPKPEKLTAGFSLKIMAPYWGFNGSVKGFCRKAKQDGYDGVEILWSQSISQELFEALNEYKLEVGFLCRGDEPAPDSHLSTFQRVLKEAVDNKHQKPLYINVHSGKDFFTYEDNKKFIDSTVRYAKETGVPIYHEKRIAPECSTPLLHHSIIYRKILICGSRWTFRTGVMSAKACLKTRRIRLNWRFPGPIMFTQELGMLRARKWATRALRSGKQPLKHISPGGTR